MVAKADGTVVQKNHYYPFGMEFAENSGDSDQPYKYNGKELDNMHGLNMYDYSARYYEPAIGRFTTVDPLAEKYYSWSPYSYCANNPIKFIDPNGMDYYFINNKGETILALKTNDDYDKLFAFTGSALRKDFKFEGVTIHDRSLLPQLSVKNDKEIHDGQYAITNNVSDAFNLYKYVADNTNVEWSISGFKSANKQINFYIGTDHNESEADTGRNLPEFANSEMLFNLHSHPDPDGTRGASGYMGEGMLYHGDMAYITRYYKNLKPNQVLPPHYVYHKYTQTLYQYNPWIYNINKGNIKNGNQLKSIINR